MQCYTDLSLTEPMTAWNNFKIQAGFEIQKVVSIKDFAELENSDSGRDSGMSKGFCNTLD